MPSWYVHIQAAAETMEKLKAGVPAGSPLTQAEANALFTAAHDHRNYLAAGALGPDLFFLLPDFKGDAGKGLLALAEFVLTTWKALDETFVEQWEQWMTPVLDEANTLANSISGGMLGEVSTVLDLLSGSVDNLVLGVAGQMVDVFGQLTSGTQMGYADSAFFWSDMFHYRKTYQFARRLYQNALLADEGLPPGEPSRVPKQQAFALGWMSHCATDVAAHPFTNAKCGGPYRTHWQRHHVIENHMDAEVYRIRHMPMTNYDSVDTAALQFRLAFRKSATSPDPTMPDDEPGPDYFPGSWDYPEYLEAESEAASRKATFDLDTEPFPEHICELLQMTMLDVHSGVDDRDGPLVLRWDPGKSLTLPNPATPGTVPMPGGRPTTAVLQEMFDLAFTYAKYTSSSGLAPRMPLPPSVIGDHDLPRPPGLPADGMGADPSAARPMTLLDILLAILAFALYIAELVVWLATVLPAMLTDLATWPLRELLYQLLVVPAWDLYMLCRKPLVLEGFLSPKTSEISNGLVRLGADEKGALVQLRADLDAPSGFASLVDMAEPSGLNPLGPAPGGYGLDPAYPRAMLTDLDPPWLNIAPIDSNMTPSEFVAPWRYPAHNMAGMRNGWEAPRTHVGPYVQGQNARVLMGGLPGSDSARHRYEAARSPAETEAVSAELLTMPGQHLGDPIDYGAYLIGQLTGHWTPDTTSPTRTYAANDSAAPLPDFNLDSDRGYAYQCWDYMRHAESKPGSPVLQLDTDWPDQWGCAPQILSILSEIQGRTKASLEMDIRAWYGYPEPCTVPQRFDARDNPHHRSRYDPLKRLAHQYLPRSGDPALMRGWDMSDLQVSDAENLAAGMSPTGRPVP